MRAFTTKTNIVAKDLASKAFRAVAISAKSMGDAVAKQAKIAKLHLNNLSKNIATAESNFKKKFAGAESNFKKKFAGAGIAGMLSLGLVVGNVVSTFANFEQANVNLASVMGKTVDETFALQNNAKRLGAITAKSATEVVGLQEAFARLGFGERDIINMTESTIAGSVAMQSELASTAELVGAVVKSFDNFSSVDAPQIIDQLTLSTQKSALNFEKLNVALPIVAGAANAANVPFTKLTSMLGILSDAGIDASSSATALRKILSVTASKGISVEQAFAKIASSQNKVKTASELFGLTAQTQALVLANNIDKLKELDITLQSAAGTAAGTASKQLDTLKGSVTILGSAWEGFVLSLEDGKGAFSGILKDIVKVATEILSLASGTAKAESELSAAELRIRKFANAAIFVIKTIGILVASYAALKVAIVAANAVLIVGKFLRFAAAAIQIARAQGIWTAAQWALNAAMTANPIGLIVAGIAALIGVITLLVKYWDNVKAAMVGFFDAIKDNPILNALVKPINWAIDKFKSLLSVAKEVFGFFSSETGGGGNGTDLKKLFPGVANFVEKSGLSKLQGKSNAEIFGAALNKLDAKFGIKDKLLVNSQNKLITSLNNNTNQLAENTKKEWSGKFATTILKDMNVSPNNVPRNLASTAIATQVVNQNAQKEILAMSKNNTNLPTESYTQQSVRRSVRNSNNTNGTININVIDRTGGKYGIQVDSVGVEVVTTGNND